MLKLTIEICSQLLWPWPHRKSGIGSTDGAFPSSFHIDWSTSKIPTCSKLETSQWLVLSFIWSLCWV